MRIYYSLRIGRNEKETMVFTGLTPEGAALKAAKKGVSDMYLRERGKKILHHFTGSREALSSKKGFLGRTIEQWKPSTKKLETINLG